METKNLAFNMQGYVILFDSASYSWSWAKWDYAETNGKENRRVVRRTGGLEFMKMMPSLFGMDTVNKKPVTNQEEMDSTLKKEGVEFVFLYEGDVLEETQFSTVEEALEMYNVYSIPAWDLTDYWFSYDSGIQSWAMYDTFSGQLEFTPAGAAERLESTPRQTYQGAASNYQSVPQNVTYH